MTISSVVVIIIFGLSEVYYRAKDRRLEFFNEFIILCCSYHYYLFTDFVPDPDARYTMGYSLIVVTIICLTVNLSFMVHGTITKFIYLVKKLKS